MTTQWARVGLIDDVYVVQEIYAGDPLFEMGPELRAMWHSYDLDSQDVKEGWTWNGEVFEEPAAFSRDVETGFSEAMFFIYGKLTQFANANMGILMVDYIRHRDLGVGTTPICNEWNVFIDNVIYEGVTNYATPDFESITAPTTTFADIVAEVDAR